MAQIDFGGVVEEVITSDEFPLERSREVLKGETIAVLGYGVQGPGQALNLRDNGFPVIVGQREGGETWDKALRDGFVPGQTLFPVEEAARRGSVIQYLLSDAGQVATCRVTLGRRQSAKNLRATATLRSEDGLRVTTRGRP